MLACAFSENDFERLRSVLAKLGLKVAAKTESELFESFDVLQAEFGDPNSISWRYQKGLDAPPPSKLRFGNYEFPGAQKILDALGIKNITAHSTKSQVVKLLGKPDESGGDTKVPVLGYIDPWIKYKRSDCQLRFSFEKGKAVKMVTLLESDWEPGM